MTELKPRDECLYYLVREMDGLGVKAKDIYFEDALQHIKESGLIDMRHIETIALIDAARERGRLSELEAAVSASSKLEDTSGRNKKMEENSDMTDQNYMVNEQEVIGKEFKPKCPFLDSIGEKYITCMDKTSFINLGKKEFENNNDCRDKTFFHCFDRFCDCEDYQKYYKGQIADNAKEKECISCCNNTWYTGLPDGYDGQEYCFCQMKQEPMEHKEFCEWFNRHPDWKFDEFEQEQDEKIDITDAYMMPVRYLIPNHNNPRKTFDQESLDELTESVRQVGVLEPLLVVKEEGQYRIIAGERRYRAAKAAGLEKVPVIVREITEEEEFEIMMVENLHRDDLDPIEEATAYSEAIRRGYKQKELAERLGITQGQVANRCRLLKLPEKIQSYISRKIITAGHGLALIKIAHLPDMVDEVVKEIQDTDMPVSKVPDRVNYYISKGLPLYSQHWNSPKFDTQEVCIRTKCKYRIHAKEVDGKEHPYCLDKECWEKHQLEAENDWFHKEEARLIKKAEEMEKEQEMPITPGKNNEDEKNSEVFQPERWIKDNDTVPISCIKTSFAYFDKCIVSEKCLTCRSRVLGEEDDGSSCYICLDPDCFYQNSSIIRRCDNLAFQIKHSNGDISKDAWEDLNKIIAIAEDNGITLDVLRQWGLDVSGLHDENEQNEPLVEQKCRVCGCTDDHACAGGCYWVEPDLCSRCVGTEHKKRILRGPSGDKNCANCGVDKGTCEPYIGVVEEGFYTGDCVCDDWTEAEEQPEEEEPEPKDNTAGRSDQQSVEESCIASIEIICVRADYYNDGKIVPISFVESNSTTKYIRGINQIWHETDSQSNEITRYSCLLRDDITIVLSFKNGCWYI